MRVVIYGATGYTGKLIAAELARRDIPFALSGRSAEKLAAVAGDYPGCAIRPASIDDPAALHEAFGDARVVINAAGPFVFTGAPILRAAITANAHYLDTTGEQPWIKQVYDEFDADLRSSKVAAVAGMGFDYVPGDLLCHLVGRRLQPLSELVVAYHVADFGMTRGTMRSALEMLKGGDVTYTDGQWVATDTKPLRARVTFPSPVGEQVMGRYPAGELITVPHHLKVQTVRAMLSNDFPSPIATAVPLFAPGLQKLLKTNVRRRLQKLVERLPEGPSEEARRGASWTIICRATGEKGSVGHGFVRGRDIYGLTAKTIAEGVVRMLADDYDRAGAHSPASAFDALELLESLQRFGVTWELGPAAARAAA